MGFSDKFKKVLKREKVSAKDLAEMVGKTPQMVYNTMHTDGGTSPKKGDTISPKYGLVEEWLDVLGYDIVFRNRETGEIIE